MSNLEPVGPALSQEQWERLRSLAITLSPDQASWVGGYFTGYADAARRGTGPAAPDGTTATIPTTVEAQRALTVLYGSETGNAMLLAESIAAKALALGLKAAATDMADYRAAALKEEHDLLLVVSTYGEGDPPQPALSFFEFLDSRKAPKLDSVQFGVLALGDSTYEFYCEAGKRLDRRLAELGATRLAERIDCDVDELKAGEAWAEALLARLVESRAATVPATPATAAPAPAVPVFERDNPFLAPVLENLVLTGRGSSKQTRHLELDLAGSGLTYEPGDALGIVPRNDPTLVAELVKTLGADGNAVVNVDGRQVSFAAALEEAVEIAALTPRFLSYWAEAGGAGADALAQIATADAAERARFLEAHHLIDLARLYPVEEVSPQDLVGALRRLQPRLYSIASSQPAQDGAAHLTVSTIAYELHGSPRFGVVSGGLARLGDAVATLPVYIKPNPNFRLPGDEVPMIMIGAGTGVAPYRAFLQERERRGAKGRSWLVFGERIFRSDFLYQVEWQGHLASGALTRMDVAFSRDGDAKVYVQHRLREQARDIYAWLEDGAHLYVCGDANGMAPDVHAALADIIVGEGGRTAEAAEDYLRDLQRQRRYSRDVY